jgi:hypothetical protein
VLSRCEATGEVAYKRVVKVFEHGFASLSAVSCNYSAAFREKFGDISPLILATAEHPFWVQGKGWTAVRDLQPGDEFLTHDNDQVVVKEISSDCYRSPVFNLEVEDFHTYFADVAGIWVHNKRLEIAVSQLNTKAVANPRSEWSPLFRSAAELTDANGASSGP